MMKNNKNCKVGVNDFVKRQVKGSGKTYSKSMSFSDIAKHAQKQMNLNLFSDGYRDGVRIVNADPSIIDDFVCPFVLINEETKLISRIVRRQNHEEPYIQTRALNGKLLEAGKVEFILYRYDVLQENDENTTDADWELISINSVPKGVSFLPIGPVTMMRNQLNLEGGTKAYYSSKQWADSIRFYQKYIALEPNNNN